jgi:hypothetical protein
VMGWAAVYSVWVGGSIQCLGGRQYTVIGWAAVYSRRRIVARVKVKVKTASGWAAAEAVSGNLAPGRYCGYSLTIISVTNQRINGTKLS